MHTTSMDGPLEPALPRIAVQHLPDTELENRLKRLAGIEHKALVLLLAHLGEFDQRRLHADRGHPSLFSYCMRVLGYSEQAAYKRIQVARAARAHPAILERLAAGELTLTAVVILAPHLRADNALQLLEAARGRRTREVEALAAELAPRPDSPDCLRALPAPSQSNSPREDLESASPQREPLGGDPCELVEPLSAQRYLFRFTGSATLLTKYERARELLGAVISAGSPIEAVVEKGLDALLDKLDPRRRLARRRARARRDEAGREDGADASASRRSSRRISAIMRDEVWERDGGRCTFVGPDGARCPSTGRLEIDHVRPYAFGGPSDDPANLRVMCRTHNQLLARRVFGSAAGTRHRTPNS